MRRHTFLALSAAASAAVAAAGFALPASASSSFIQGTATGTAQAMQLSPRNGGFAYNITVGSTVADYRGSLGQASSQSLDLGLIGTSLTSQQCDGSKPTISHDQLPQPLVVESDHGNATKSQDDTGMAQGGLLAVGGHKSVSVTTVPSASAAFDGGAVGIKGLVEASGLSSSSHAELVPGKARVATAEASVGRLSLLGGAVVFGNLHWTATQRTGEGAAASGTFNVGDAFVGGKKLAASPDQLAQVFDAVNKGLAQSGLHVYLPVPKKNAGGALVVPPLTVGIANSALGAAVVNPLLTAAQPVMAQIENALLGVSCKFGSVFTVRDIFLASVDGTGGLDISFGGVQAGSDGTSYGNPFGPVSLGSSSGAPVIGASGGQPGSASAAGAVGGAAPPPTTPGAAAPAVAAPQLAGSTKTASSCSTTSSAKWPGCSNGAALAVGLLGLVAVGAVAGGDWLATRRRRGMPQLDL